MSHPSAALEKKRGGAPPRRFLNPQDGCWHVQITQGETHVTDNPQELLTTILGSCIAACIRDPQQGLGGMNHFLLPNSDGEDRDAMRYGVNAMELLINGLLKKGASRSRLQAKLFGGANVLPGLSDVGSRNATFAEKYLADEGIVVVGGDVRGTKPRRIQYWPTSGRARQLAMPPVDSTQLVERELARSFQIRKPERAGGDDVELF